MSARSALPVLSALLFATSASAEVPADAREARAVLEKHCYRCHGEKGAAEGGMNFVLDRDKLVAKRVVVPNDAGKSPLLKRMVGGDMPADDKTKPTDAEIAAVKAWITNGANPFDAPAAKRKLVDRDDVAKLIAADLNKPANAGRQRFLRYFTLTHLANANRPEEELQTQRNGLIKLVNSLSWGRKLVQPEALDEGKTVFRIDLRDVQWSFPVWDTIATAHPYNLDHKDAVEQKIAAQTQTRVWAVRGDWFVATASRPPLYHQVLQIPTTVAALETRLGVDVARNRINRTFARAGFNGSGVSHNNRLIERHESYFGAYWKSYDFAGNAGRQNLFDHPLGPGEDVTQFVHDGGEMIFNLPNGLQGYMLTDGKGNRIDKGPTSIVSDPARPDRAVENGISCMGCHSQGIIRKDDQIRAHVLKNQSAYQEPVAVAVFTQYPERTELNKLYDEDLSRFQKAVEGIRVPLTKTEPIITTAKRYEDELDLSLVLAEVDTNEATFGEMLQLIPNLARPLGAVLVTGGTIKRDLLVQSFPALQKALGRQHYTPTVVAAPTAKRPCGIDDAAMLFSPRALRDMQRVIDELKEERKLDLAIVTLDSVPDADFADFVQGDTTKRNAIVVRMTNEKLKELNPTGFILVIVREMGWHTRVVGNKNVNGITQVNVDQIHNAIGSAGATYPDTNFDAGLRAFVTEAKKVLIERTEKNTVEPGIAK